MKFKAMRGVVQHFSAKQGFTLLEVLVAVLILGLAYVAVLQNFSISLNNIEKIGNIRQAVFDELLAFSESIKYTSPDLLEDEEEEEGTLFIEGESYRLMEVKSESGELATLKLQPIL